MSENLSIRVPEANESGAEIRPEPLAYQSVWSCDTCGLEIAGIEDIDDLPPPAVIQGREPTCKRQCRFVQTWEAVE